MSKEMAVIVLGIWIIAVPYLGVPSSWKTVLFVLTGIVLAGVGFLLRGEAISRGDTRTRNYPFVDNSSNSPRHDHEGITSLN